VEWTVPSVFNEFLNSRKRKISISLLLLIGLGFLAFNCAPTRMELGNKDIDDLKELWLKSDNLDTRIEIVQELESRKATEALIFCLDFPTYFQMANWPYYDRSGLSNFKIKDCLVIIDSLGRMKNTLAIEAITDAVRRLSYKEIKIAVLKAYKEIGSLRSVLPTTEFLSDPESEVRWQAMDTLGHIKDPESMKSIFPLLYDKNSEIRFKAIYTLGKIGNTKAIGQISLLLADKDESVRGFAETVLRKLGAPEEKIEAWKEKAKHLSLEDVHRSRIAYQRAVMEKEVLKTELESETDIKRQLKATLQERESALKKQEALVAFLYEKERQLKSKLIKLEQVKKETEKNRKKLKSLENKAQKISKELDKNKETVTLSKKGELERILRAKSEIEADAQTLKERESKLRDEVAVLSAMAEKMRLEAENAKKALKEEKKRAAVFSERLETVTKQKEALEERLKNESDFKRELEAALKDREIGDRRQQSLLSSLYEKERQLKDKSFQLEETLKETESKREALEGLRAKAKALRERLEQKEAQKQEDTLQLKAELDSVLKAKSSIEKEADNLRVRELRLKDELSSLRSLAEKTRSEAEYAKKELATMRERETGLIMQVDSLKKRLDRGMAPVLVISRPKNGTTTQSPVTVLNVIIVDDKGIDNLSITLNGKPIKLGTERGVEISAIGKRGISKKMNITERLPLEHGENRILVSARDTDGMKAEEMVTVTREKERGKIWAIVIGINRYQNTRKLKYAVNDARAFRNYIKEHIGIPEENIFFLTNQRATKAEIQSLLGTKIKRKASKEDTVIIFYAGHGAVETDPLNPDGDGFEKYLLPYDANLDDLYSTAIAMGEINKIFHRIRAERLIFIADTCYSGASGGRTMLASKTRATLSEKFFERISKGKGRVIISACSANEISKEDDSLEHGVFTYYLLKGLKGGADFDGDGIITVSELFGFLSKKVPEASGQDQHPVRKGETEGELVIGRIK